MHYLPDSWRWHRGKHMNTQRTRCQTNKNESTFVNTKCYFDPAPHFRFSLSTKIPAGHFSDSQNTTSAIFMPAPFYFSSPFHLNFYFPSYNKNQKLKPNQTNKRWNTVNLLGSKPLTIPKLKAEIFKNQRTDKKYWQHCQMRYKWDSTLSVGVIYMKLNLKIQQKKS